MDIISRLGTSTSIAVDKSSLEVLVTVLQHDQIAKYTAVATCTLLFYDWFLTIDEEVFLVWPSKWGAPKVLYFLNRYVAFGDPIMLIYVLIVGSDASSCVKVFQSLGGTSALGFVVAQLILMMRTWAIWERRTSVTILLVVLLVAAFVTDIFVLTRYLSGVSYFSLPGLSVNGCLLQFKSRIVYVDFIVVMVTESMMLALLVTKALQHFKHSRSTLMVRMFNDGVVYFVFIFITSIANLCTILVAPVELHNFLIITQRVFHSIFCTRVLLHIRGAYTNNALLTSSADDPAASRASYARWRRSSRVHSHSRGVGSGLESVGSVHTVSGQVYGGAGWGQGCGYDVPDGKGLDEFELERVGVPHGVTPRTFPDGPLGEHTELDGKDDIEMTAYPCVRYVDDDVTRRRPV